MKLKISINANLQDKMTKTLCLFEPHIFFDIDMQATPLLFHHAPQTKSFHE